MTGPSIDPVSKTLEIAPGVSASTSPGQSARQPFPPSNRTPAMDIQAVSVGYEGRASVLDRISFSVREGEFICLLGPSGCGKSTLLKAIAGFVPISAGKILSNGTQVTAAGPDRGMVFQEFALFPWLTVEQNIVFGDHVRRMSKSEQKALTAHYLSLIGLTEARTSLPRQLSGGMKQRVALARAWANQPQVLLMDEPFGALDARTRQELQFALLDIWAEKRTTCLFVTHDTQEAVLLADRIVIMDVGGHITSIVDPGLRRPRDRFSPEFVAAVRNIERQVWGDPDGR